MDQELATWLKEYQTKVRAAYQAGATNQNVSAPPQPPMSAMDAVLASYRAWQPPTPEQMAEIRAHPVVKLDSITGLGSKILDIADRGLYSTAGAVKNVQEQLQGRNPEDNVGEAFVKGLTGKTKYTYNDVVKGAGVTNPALVAGLGLLGNIVLDPTNALIPPVYRLARRGVEAGVGAVRTGKAVPKVAPTPPPPVPPGPGTLPLWPQPKPPTPTPPVVGPTISIPAPGWTPPTGTYTIPKGVAGGWMPPVVDKTFKIPSTAMPPDQAMGVQSLLHPTPPTTSGMTATKAKEALDSLPPEMTTPPVPKPVVPTVAESQARTAAAMAGIDESLALRPASEVPEVRPKWASAVWGTHEGNLPDLPSVMNARTTPMRERAVAAMNPTVKIDAEIKDIADELAIRRFELDPGAAPNLRQINEVISEATRIHRLGTAPKKPTAAQTKTMADDAKEMLTDLRAERSKKGIADAIAPQTGPRRLTADDKKLLAENDLPEDIMNDYPRGVTVQQAIDHTLTGEFLPPHLEAQLTEMWKADQAAKAAGVVPEAEKVANTAKGAQTLDQSVDAAEPAIRHAVETGAEVPTTAERLHLNPASAADRKAVFDAMKPARLEPGGVQAQAKEFQNVVGQLGRLGRHEGETARTYATRRGQKIIEGLARYDEKLMVAGVRPRIMGRKSHMQYPVSLGDVLRSLPPDVVGGIAATGTRAGAKAQASLHPTQIMSGAAHALDLATDLGMTYEAKLASIKDAIIWAKGPAAKAARSDTVDLAAEAMVHPGFAQRLQDIMTSHAVEWGVADVRQAEALSRFTTESVLKILSDPEIAASDMARSVVEASKVVAEQAKAMGASPVAEAIAQKQVADALAKVVNPHQAVAMDTAVKAADKLAKDIHADVTAQVKANVQDSLRETDEAVRMANQGGPLPVVENFFGSWDRARMSGTFPKFADDIPTTLTEEELRQFRASWKTWYTTDPTPGQITSFARAFNNAKAGAIKADAMERLRRTPVGVGAPAGTRSAGAAASPPPAPPAGGGGGRVPPPPSGPGAGAAAPPPPSGPWPITPSGPPIPPPGGVGGSIWTGPAVDILDMGERSYTEVSGMFNRFMRGAKYGYGTGGLADIYRNGQSIAVTSASGFHNGLSKVERVFDTPTIEAATSSLLRGGVMPTDARVLMARKELATSFDLLFDTSGSHPANGLMGVFFRHGWPVDRINAALKEAGSKFEFPTTPGLTPAQLADSWKDWAWTDPLGELSRLYHAAAHTTMRMSLGHSYSRTFGKFAIPAGANPKDWVKIKPNSSALTEFVDTSLYYPRHEAEMFHNMSRLHDEPYSFHGKTGGIAWFMNKVLDPTMAIWKPFMTIARVGHHVRNLIGDMFQSYMGGMSSLRHYKMAGEIMSMAGRKGADFRGTAAVKAYKRGEVPTQGIMEGFQSLRAGTKPGMGKTMITLKGHNLTGDNIYRLAEQNGLLESYIVRQDLEDPTKVAAAANKKTGTLVKVLTQNRYMQVASNVSETESHFAKLAHFTWLIDNPKFVGKYGSFQEAVDGAVKEVRHWHPDVTGLTPAERKNMRRLFPFYSWNKQIIPLFWQTLTTHPGRITNLPKIYYAAATATGANPNSLSDPWPQDKLIPSFLRDDTFGPVAGTFGLNIGSPTEAVLGDYLGGTPGSQWRNIYGMANPLIKGPIDLATGVQQDTGRKITDSLEYLDSNLPIVNQVSNLSGYSVSGTTGNALGNVFGNGNPWLDSQKAVVRGDKNHFDLVAISNFLSGLGLYNTQKGSYQNIAAAQIRQGGSG